MDTNSNTTKAAIYVRCSTHHQNTDLQKEQLIDYCQKRNWAYQIYDDAGISGGKDSRPALDQLMQDARQLQFNVVVVLKFDRFARSISNLINSLNEFNSLGISFVSISEAIDTTTPAGRLVFSVIAAIAEFERSLIRERVNAGLRRAKQNGVRLGRPRKGFDYPRALEMKRAGASFREIGRAMGVSHVTVFNALKNAS